MTAVASGRSRGCPARIYWPHSHVSEIDMNPKRLLTGLLCSLTFCTATAQAQTTTITTEYLMTLYAPLEAPQ